MRIARDVESPGGVTVLPHIYIDADGIPGTVLETFSDQFFSGIVADLVFNSAGLALNPGTTYWLVAQTLPSLAIPRWHATTSSDQTGSWTIGDTMRRSNDSGSTWLSPDSFAGQFSISIGAVVVPKPAPHQLACAAGCGLARVTVWRRSRRRHGGIQ